MLLVDKGCRVTVLERREELGGRISTRVHDGVTMDTGAARFNRRHVLLWGLIERYGLEDALFKIPTGHQYVKDSRRRTFDTTGLLKKVIAMGKEAAGLRGITLEQFIKERMPEGLVDDIICSFGYNTEFERMNAEDALRIFEHDFLFDIDYYVLGGGLGRLVDRMRDDLKARGCRFVMGEAVGVERAGQGVRVVLGDGKVLVGDRAVLCVGKRALLGLEGVASGNKALARSLETVGGAALYRIFARFPVGPGREPRAWFHGMKKTTTNNILRYVIPLDSERGVVMISYTDGRYAEALREVGDMEGVVMRHARKLFPGVDIPDPLWMKGFYWSEGVHYWKPGAFKYRNTRKGVERLGYAVAGEVISPKNHGWIEGALDTAKRAVSCVL